MDRKILLWLILAFVAGGFFAARQSMMEQQTPPSQEHLAEIFLIAPQDADSGNKEIGCNDSTVAIQKKVIPKDGPVQDALKALFDIKNEHYGESGLYNALYQSDLKVESVNQADDAISVKLSGTLKLGGACDNPRVRAQLEKTIKAATKIDTVKVWINNKPLEEVLSGR